MRRTLRDVPLLVRLGAELAIVVVGVLIALSADAWRDAQTDRAEEARHLLALREDFTESLLLLDASGEERAGITTALLNLLERDLGEVPSDSVGQWVFGGLWNIGAFAFRLTALRDLEASGEIQLLTPQLRRGIAEFNRRVEVLELLEEDYTKSQQGLMDVYIVRELPLAPILAVSDTLPISERLPAEANWAALETTQARSLMAFKLSLGKVGTERSEDIREQIAVLLDMVAERLAELGVDAGR